MNKTLPTLGNEKEQQQIEFYEKLSDELIFSRVTKNLKMFHSLARLGEYSKSKVTALTAYPNSFYLVQYFFEH